MAIATAAEAEKTEVVKTEKSEAVKAEIGDGKATRHAMNSVSGET